MLYQLYETQRALMAPFSEFASASAKLYSHPLSPFAHTPMAQRVSAGFDLMHRLAKEYEKPEFDITSATVGGVEVAVQEQVAIDKPFCRLLRFKRFTDNPAALDADEDAAHRAGGGAAVGPPLDAAARHRAARCCTTTRSSSPTGPTRAWCRWRPGRSTWTTTSPTCRSSSATSAPRCT